MLRHRIIPVLLLLNDDLVKTIKFNNPKYVGDPINVVKIFNEKEVDELIVIDISASREARGPNFYLIEELAGECFMPLTYGGGITSVEDANFLFGLGIEKICLQAGILSNPRLVTELANKFGSQSIVVSIDVKRNWLGNPCLYDAMKRELRKESWLEMGKKYIDAGAGEVLLNSVDRDGTLSGPDMEIIEKAAKMFSVPLIALGGISSLQDIKNTIESGASAVAAGSFFVYQGPHRAVLITYPKSNELENLFN